MKICEVENTCSFNSTASPTS